MRVSPFQLYTLLLSFFGTQHWWPVDSTYHRREGSDPRFEIVIGAILTQNTAWVNVEKALENIKQKRALSLEKIMELPDEQLRILIQPTGFFNQKMQRIKQFLCFLKQQYSGNLDRFFNRELCDVREELLSLTGIGPETADSMLLYAGNHAVFVVDAYTRRIAARLPFPVASNTYDDVQRFFEQELQKNCSKSDLVYIYKEFHALLVELAKQYCKKNRPLCTQCPVQDYCESSGVF